jgi:hypothetical protein
MWRTVDVPSHGKGCDYFLITSYACNGNSCQLAFLPAGEHISCDLWTPKLLHGKTFTVAALNVSVSSVVESTADTNQLGNHNVVITNCFFTLH